MNILILNWKDVKNPEVGGAEIIAFEFARRLVRDGHSVTYFTSQFEGSKQEETIDGVKIVRRGSVYTVYFHAYRYYKTLTQKPDRVIEMINTICWQSWLYVPKEKRIAYLNQLAREVWFYEFPWIVAFIGNVFERLEYLFYTSTSFLCYSESTKQDLISYGIPEKNIQTFPMGLDHKRYIPGKKKTEYPLFIFVARLVKMKRADLCIQAMRYVIKKFPSAKLAIVGNGKEEKNLESLVKENSLEENVVFVNKDNFFIDGNKKDTKLRLMQEAWALLLPSVKEGWGMVVTEAAACGTPSIVSDVTGLRDSVQDGKSGVMISNNPTPLEIADAMNEIISNNKKRESLSKGAVKWSQEFTWEKSYNNFKKYICEYEKKSS